MKRNLLLIATLVMSLSVWAVPYDSTDVPGDFTNDIQLNTDYKELQVGSTYKIVARRLPEIIDNYINNNITLPEFTYEIIEGTSATVDASTGVVTAAALGKTIIEVGYKAVTANGVDYAAISPVNKTYMVVNVVDSTVAHGMEITTNITATSYDTYYFAAGDGYDFNFTASATNATQTTVSCNGTALTAGTDGSYTARLRNRANIIEVEATNATGTKRWAQVIDARRIEVNIANITHPDQPVCAGDSVHISFDGLVPPIYKMASFYNPCMEFQNTPNPAWRTEAPKVRYLNLQLDSVKTNVDLDQYLLNSHNTMAMRLNSEGEYFFYDGIVRASWYGQPLGTEKNYDGKLTGGPAAPTQHAALSKLPAIRINVLPAIDLTQYTVDTLVAARLMDLDGAIDYRADSIWDQTYNDAADYAMLNDANFVAYHMPSANSWRGTSWEGFTVSRQQQSGFEQGGVSRQFSNAAGGGLDSANAPYLLGYYSYYIESSGTAHSCQIDLATDPRQLLGVWVVPTGYTYKTAIVENPFGRIFTKGDTLTITAHGLNADGEDNGKVVRHYIADYRSAASANRYMQQGWEWIDLRALGIVSGVYFTMESSDSGIYGPNTATYFAMDGLTTIRATSDGGTTGCDRVEAAALTVYPNPVRDIVNITAADGLTAVVYNLQGQAVTSATVVSGQINLSHLTAGAYIIRVADSTARIIKL